MIASPKQLEFWREANHRWNFKVGATRSGKTYMDYFLIPRRLLQAAGIDQSVHIIGVNNTIEIWSDAEYEATFFPDAEFATKLKAMMAPRS